MTTRLFSEISEHDTCDRQAKRQKTADSHEEWSPNETMSQQSPGEASPQELSFSEVQDPFKTSTANLEELQDLLQVQLAKQYAYEEHRRREVKQKLVAFHQVYNKPTPMPSQTAVTTVPQQAPSYLSDRECLAEWLFDAGNELGLASMTVAYALEYVDRFVAAYLPSRVKRCKYQQIACACLSIAAKREEKEEKVPSFETLADYTMGSCTPASIAEMEVLVLDKLQWNLAAVTPYHFVEIVSKMRGIPESVVRCTMQIFEILCIESVELGVRDKFLPSVIADAAICAGMWLAKEVPVFSGLDNEGDELFECAVHLHKLYNDNI